MHAVYVFNSKGAENHKPQWAVQAGLVLFIV